MEKVCEALESLSGCSPAQNNCVYCQIVAEYFTEQFLSDELKQFTLSSPYLLNVIECALHALNRMISPILHILRFQHLRKGPLPLLSYETIFSHLI